MTHTLTCKIVYFHRLLNYVKIFQTKQSNVPVPAFLLSWTGRANTTQLLGHLEDYSELLPGWLAVVCSRAWRRKVF